MAEPEHITVTVGLDRVVRLEGVLGHRSGTLFDEDVVVVRGVVATSQARTLIDLFRLAVDGPAGPSSGPVTSQGTSLEAVRLAAGGPQVCGPSGAGAGPADDSGAHAPRRAPARLRPRRQRPRDQSTARAGVSRVARSPTAARRQGRRAEVQARPGLPRCPCRHPSSTAGKPTASAFHGTESVTPSWRHGWVVVHFSACTPDHEMVAAVRLRFEQSARGACTFGGRTDRRQAVSPAGA